MHRIRRSLSRDHLFERQEIGIGGHERIGREHFARVARQRLLELVAQRSARIVALGLERHAEQPDRHLGEIVIAAQLADDVQRQPLVDHDGGIAERELVSGEGQELHGVLDQARARGKARRRDVCARG